MIWNVGHAGIWNDTLSVLELENMEKAYTWNGDIALATKSEYIRANSSDSCLTASVLYSNSRTCSTTNYLYKSAYWYWLLSPYSSRVHYPFNVSTNGNLNYNYANSQSGSVLPALYIKSNITLSGNGGQESEDMYRIVS